MTELVFRVDKLDSAYLDQLRYALSFAAEGILEHAMDGEGALVVIAEDQADLDLIRRKVNQLIERYADPKLGLRSNVYFRQQRECVPFDAWTALVSRGYVTPIGEGHVVLRGLAARLFKVIDNKAVSEFAQPSGAEEEIYPATILCSTLDQTNHFTSFPEHVDFVSHLREDVDVLTEFSNLCGDGGWKPGHHEARMAPPDFAVSPSCCYHCYEGMRDWEIEGDGRCVTAVLDCHRYEGGNLKTLSRLRAFHMREVIWVGKPGWVIEERRTAEATLVQWAKDWEVDCSLELANDMFFTDDYAVKASFQRQQEAKKELRLRIPQEESFISCASSNFHAASFGRAFSIKAGRRPAISACLGWGHERWIYAIFSQFGMEPESWPEGLRNDLERYA